MADLYSILFLDIFYLEADLKLTDINQQKDKILIRMKAISKNCRCPKCNCFTDMYHGTFNRKVQDPTDYWKRCPA